MCFPLIFYVFAIRQLSNKVCKKEMIVKNAYFYIPYLIKKEAMNSSETEFDGYFTEGESERPFIETSKKRELPISTKVVVHQGESIIKFFVDKKLVVTGADGMMLLRMYLSPLSKDEDGEIEEQKETTVEGINKEIPSTGEGSTNSAGLGSGLVQNIEVETAIENVGVNSENVSVNSEEQPKPKKKRTYTRRKKKTTTNTVVNADNNLEMNIPED